MELRSLILLGLCLLISQCSEARHSMHRRDTDEELFADEPLNDDDAADRTTNDEPAILAKILTAPKTQEVHEGDDVTLECQVEPDNGSVVQWYKGNDLYFMNRIKMADDPYNRYSIASNSRNLLIQKVQETDSGVYRCELAQQQVVSVNHTVVVLVAPRIIRFTATNSGSVVEGQDLHLTCEVSGTPPPQIVWSRAVDNGNQRLNEQDGEFSTNSVHIRSVKREYSGKYYCYAINSVGHNQAELEITVAGKPHVHVHKTVINSAVGVEAILQCSAKFDYNPHIRWYKDGALIEDSSSSFTVSTHHSHSNLTVVPRTDSDFGTFTCEAENDIGKHNRSIALVQTPVVEEFGSDSGKLLWTVHSHQPIVEMHAQIRSLSENDGIWKQFDIPLPSTTGHKYDLAFDLNDKHLEPGKYEAVVSVKNEHSWNDMVEPVAVEIEIQPEYIQHASVYRGSAHSLRPAALLSILMLLVRM